MIVVDNFWFTMKVHQHFFTPSIPVIRPILHLSISAVGAVLLLGGSSSAALLETPVDAAFHKNAGASVPWTLSAERNDVADFLTHSLPVAGNKADLGNAAMGFFRTPEPSANDTGVILYVGLCAQEAPVGSQYRIPLFSGSIESFRLGLAEAKPAPQTVGDIGEIYADDAAPVPMAYIVYRLEFGTRNEAIRLFATPTLTPEPVTTGSPEDSPIVINSKFVWEDIRFNNMPTLEDRDVDWQTERPLTGRIVPEPASAAIFAFGLLGLATRLRPRS